jgi:hypothetical protein
MKREKKLKTAGDPSKIRVYKALLGCSENIFILRLEGKTEIGKIIWFSSNGFFTF